MIGISKATPNARHAPDRPIAFLSSCFLAMSIERWRCSTITSTETVTAFAHKRLNPRASPAHRLAFAEVVDEVCEHLPRCYGQVLEPDAEARTRLAVDHLAAQRQPVPRCQSNLDADAPAARHGRRGIDMAPAPTDVAAPPRITAGGGLPTHLEGEAHALIASAVLFHHECS